LNTQILTAILSKDSKDSTYKYALLRAMVQCVTDQNPHKEKAENGWITYPFGLLIYYWILYYYPIFSSVKRMAKALNLKEEPRSLFAGNSIR